MTIKRTIDDAIAAKAAGLYRAAFILSLVAIAGAARWKYPRDRYRDSESFKKYLHDGFRLNCMPEITVRLRGVHRNLIDVFYHEVRCSLIHEAELPVDITINHNLDDLSLGADQNELTLGGDWVDFLLNILIQDPFIRKVLSDYHGHDPNTLGQFDPEDRYSIDHDMMKMGLSKEQVIALKNFSNNKSASYLLGLSVSQRGRLWTEAFKNKTEMRTVLDILYLLGSTVEGDAQNTHTPAILERRVMGGIPVWETHFGTAVMTKFLSRCDQTDTIAKL